MLNCHNSCNDWFRRTKKNRRRDDVCFEKRSQEEEDRSDNASDRKFLRHYKTRAARRQLFVSKRPSREMRRLQ